jgi:hypothetical protein
MIWMLALVKQEDVFKSISQNVGAKTDPKVFYVAGLLVVALVLLLSVVNSLKKRKASPRPVNHQGKLIKEILKSVPLKGGEVKQLRTMATEQQCVSPLTLVLCPSLLARGMNTRGKADKKVVMGVARKMGMVKKK